MLFFQNPPISRWKGPFASISWALVQLIPSHSFGSNRTDSDLPDPLSACFQPRV